MSASGADVSVAKSRGEHLAQYRFQKGVGGGGKGRGKGWKSLRARFREAFAEQKSPEDAASLVDVVLNLARGRIVRMVPTGERDENGKPDWDWAYIDSKNQMLAIRFAAEYGFGPPPKTDDNDDPKLAKLVAAGIAEMLRQAEEAVNRGPVVDVTATSSTEKP